MRIKRVFVNDESNGWFFYSYPADEEGCIACMAQRIHSASRFLLISKIKWNRWARREAKRIEREKK